MNPDNLKVFSRLLTGPLARTANPPVKVESHAGKGLHLLLHHQQGSFLHLCFNPPDAGKAYHQSRATSLRYLGGSTLAAWEQEWLEAVKGSLSAVEARPDWVDYLAWAADQPAVALPASEFAPEAGNTELIRVTTRCNARCDFCSARGVLSDLIRETERIPARLREMQAGGQEMVSFTGGEPTLLPELADLVGQASRIGFGQVDLQTNGLLLARRELVEKLAGCGLTSIFLSLHSDSAEIHDALLQVDGAWEKAVACVQNCLEAGLTVRYNCVLTTRNLVGPERLLEFILRRFGRDGFHFCLSYVAQQGWALDHPELVPRLTKVAPVLRSAVETADRLGIDLRIPGLCGVPICVLPDHPERFDEYHAENPPKLASRSHVAACEDCSYRRHCSGFWTAYLDRFGPDELGCGGA